MLHVIIIILKLYLALYRETTRLHFFLACGSPLVGSAKSPVLKDSGINASSKLNAKVNMGDVRIGDNNGWSPSESDKLPYLQFDLGKLHLICGFEVQGCKKSYVTRYRVHVSPEKDFLDTWNIIKVIESIIVPLLLLLALHSVVVVVGWSCDLPETPFASWSLSTTETGN